MTTRLNPARNSLTQPAFLPMQAEELRALGWRELDILLISGDAYVDHPSFGTALLGRTLVAHGYRVGVVAQPRWLNREEALADITRMGRPRLFAGVTAGAVDSLLAHYTAFRKKRSDDAYTPGGMAGQRPNRAVLVYATLARQAFPGLPVIIGGIEASLRRASHYDFWSDSLRRSIVLDSKADLLVYGMGETALLRAAAAISRTLAADPEGKTPPRALLRDELANPSRPIPGTAFALPKAQAETLEAAAPSGSHTPDGALPVALPSHEAILAEPALLLTATQAMERQVHQGSHAAVQVSGDRAVFFAPPAPPLGKTELDALYALPFSRLPHPSYKEAIPAWEMIRTSITSHRGCAGGCAFCSLALHQSRRIASRSRGSILAEAKSIAEGPEPGRRPPPWAGAISDVGGPSANMWQAACTLDPARCKRASCLHPGVCPGFAARQQDSVRLLRDVAAQPGVRHVRVASGVRFDLALQEPEALRAYTMDFTGGQLKVAPEHCSDAVLRLMRKPGLAVFEKFLAAFARLSEQAGKEQYVVPYLMSAYPGCTDADMRELAEWLRKRGWRPQQVQCFIPTPGTVASAMFYAGVDLDKKPLYVARSDAERLRQHHMLLDGESRPGHGGPKRAAGMTRLRSRSGPSHGDAAQAQRRKPARAFRK